MYNNCALKTAMDYLKEILTKMQILMKHLSLCGTVRDIVLQLMGKGSVKTLLGATLDAAGCHRRSSPT